MDEAAGMMALHAAVKAELGEDGLPAPPAEVAPAEAARKPTHLHGRLKFLQETVPVIKAGVKIEFSLDEVNVAIKSEVCWTDSTRAAVSRPPGAAVHDPTGEVADVRGWRRVQPTRGTKRRAEVSYAAVDSGSDSAGEEWISAAPPRRRKAARVTQAITWVERVGRLVTSEEEDVVWEQHLASLRAYKCRHGDCSVPQRSVEDPPLGRWVDHQRACKKLLDRGEPCRGMTAARAAKLEALGFAWDLLGASWEAQLAKLKAYKRLHGDCNVSQGWAEDLKLGRWVNSQRQSKKKLDGGEPSKGMTVARAAKLDKLGFAWELSAAVISTQVSQAGGKRDDAGWKAQLAKLKAYRQRHGDCNVPIRWAEDPQLGRWVGNQRTRKKALERGDPSKGMTAARAVKLDALGFAWKVSAAAISTQRSKGRQNDASWEVQLAKLKAYKRRHGDYNVPRGWAEDPRLANWVANQRKYKKRLDHGDPQPGMTTVRSVKLDALGFVWELQLAKHTAMVAHRAITLCKLAHKRAPRHEPGDVQAGQQ
jgi:hypothetical protein